MKIIKRYMFFLVTVLIMLILYIINRDIGEKALNITGYSLKEMMFIIPPVFVLLGLLDVWVPRQTMVKYMGEGSGIKGILLSIFLGSAAAGPLYGAFPIAGVFMMKGAKFSNVLLFIGAWSTTKIPMFLFELSALGAQFAITRLLLSMVGIFVIAFVVDKLMNRQEVGKMYENATSMNS